MQKGMFLSFWLRTKNDYFNVKSELTEKSVFKRQIKTDFIQGQDELTSGKVSYTSNNLFYPITTELCEVQVHLTIESMFL